MRCAHDECGLEVEYLRKGSLHIIDIPGAGDAMPARKIIWLCDSCSQRLVVDPWRPPGQQLQPRRKRAISGSVHIESALERAELAKSFASRELENFSSAHTIVVGSTELCRVKELPPVYPPIAKAARASGPVRLDISIGSDGHVTGTNVISGPEMLIGAAEKCVKQWIYKPVIRHGKACPVSTVVTVTFDRPLAQSPKNEQFGLPILSAA